MLFKGYIERLQEGVAYLKLVEKGSGGISFAQLEESGFNMRGLGPGDAFTLEIEEGSEKMTLTPLPKKELTEADYKEIDKKLDKLFPDSLFQP